MTNILKWRLGKLPTVEELLKLIENKLITQEEAKAMLFSSEKEADVKSLQGEIEFLRHLVENLSKDNNSTIVEVVRRHERTWDKYLWYNPYLVWCTNTLGNSVIPGSGSSSINTSSSGNTVYTTASGIPTNQLPFSDIKTF